MFLTSTPPHLRFGKDATGPGLDICKSTGKVCSASTPNSGAVRAAVQVTVGNCGICMFHDH